MPLLLKLPSLSTPLVALLLSSFLPTASAAPAAGVVDTVGFWLGFCLVLVLSAVEALASIIWTRFRVTSDGTHPCELSCRVCGREILISNIDTYTATQIANEGMPAGCYSNSHSSLTFSQYDTVMDDYSSSNGCSCFGGWENRRMEAHRGTTEAVIDKYGSLMLVPTLLIRRFNPAMGLEAPAGLFNNIKDLLRPRTERTAERMLEHAVHLLVGFADISLGVAGLVLNPSSPRMLFDTIKDPKAPMTFENYLTLFLMSWLLGVLLLLCMRPLRSTKRSIQMFGWPGAIAFSVATLANLVLFCLGCWKIDHARRHHMPWTPMLSYWIGGASAINYAVCGVELFHTFGLVGLVSMLTDTFN
ncbi:hypothetical protein FLONG3_7187 [Fusarium longipes]|uniref:Uncharacterized protein n=1 Tax=Fusarium longipes TaxID=694270 RepID=A0A395SGK5_9HYPO|nr:hypothetical protein FLONG3_7187 [Fusarium longipes]